MIEIKPSRIIENEVEVLTQLVRAFAGNAGIDSEGYLWVCGVRLGKTARRPEGGYVLESETPPPETPPP